VVFVEKERVGRSIQRLKGLVEKSSIKVRGLSFLLFYFSWFLAYMCGRDEFPLS